MTHRRLLAVAAGALCAAGLPAATASAAGTGSVLPAVKRTLTAASTTAATCDSAPAAGRGLAAASYTAPMSGYLTVRLAGRGDWDLLLRDAAGRNGRASQAFGGSEVAQTWIDAGERVTAVGCRHAGAGRRARLAFEFADVRPPALDRQKASLVRVKTGFAGQAKLENQLGLDVTHSRSARWADLIVNGPGQLAKLRAFGADFETRIADLGAYDQATLRRSRSARASALPSGRTDYRVYEDYQAELKKLVADNKALARPVVFGKSYQGRELSGIEIAKNVDGKDGRPVYFLMGVHHAREWPSGEIVMEYAQMLTKSQSDPRIAKLLETSRVVLFPLVNPDGFISSRNAPASAADATGDGNAQTGESVAPPGGVGAYRRKNCNNEDGNPSTPCESAHGVDNNRNYGNLWGGPGSSSDISSQAYHGAGPRSEPETRAVFDYVRTHHVTTLISLHTIAGLVLRPPGLHDSGKAPDEQALKALGDAMGEATGYPSQFGFQLYDTAGTTEDDTYSSTGGFGYTIEVGPPDGLFHGPYETNVIKEWLGTSDTAKGRGGLREALLKANEAAAQPASHARFAGRAVPGNVIRLRKDFDTKTSEYCLRGVEPVVATPTPPETQCPDGRKPPLTLKDKVDYKTTVPAGGRFSWHIGQSTRPFVNGGAVITTAKDIEPPFKTFNGAPGAPDSTVDHEFTLPADYPPEDRVRLHVSITAGEDYDLEVYLKQADGKLQKVGSSGGPPGADEDVLLETVQPGGTYIARIHYFAGATGAYTLTVKRVAVTSTTTTGHKEAYTLTCETPGGQVLETLKLVIDRNQLVNVRLGCGKGPSTDAAGNPLSTSLNCELPNTAPTIGCKPLPTGAFGTVRKKLTVRLRKAVRRQRVRKLRRNRYLAVRCRLNLPGRCTVTARLRGKRLGRGSVRMKRANTRTVKVKLSTRSLRRLRRGGRIELRAVARAAGAAPARTQLTVRTVRKPPSRRRR